MAQPYVGEIRIFAGNFAPAGWMFCDGPLLPISEYETLFNLIGTTYGGDGQSTFAVPDLRGRMPIHMGTNAASRSRRTAAPRGDAHASQRFPRTIICCRRRPPPVRARTRKAMCSTR